MIRRHRTLLRLLLAVGDGAGALLLIVAISEFRFGTDWHAIWARVFDFPWAVGGILVGAWLVALWSQGLYRPSMRRAFRGQAVALLKALALFALATFAALYALKLPDVSRAFLLLLLPSMALWSLLLRAGIHLLLMALRRAGRSTRNVLV